MHPHGPNPTPSGHDFNNFLKRIFLKSDKKINNSFKSLLKNGVVLNFQSPLPKSAYFKVWLKLAN